MKRILILLALSLLAVSACKKYENKVYIVGTTWHHAPDERDELKVDRYLEFKEDGTVVFTVDKVYNGTYKVNGNVVTFDGIVKYIDVPNFPNYRNYLSEGKIDGDKMIVRVMGHADNYSSTWTMDYIREK